ncbi:MAG: YybH family protein [Acidimicrobiales bacterium]
MSDERPSVTEPDDLERLFVERVNARDLDGLVALFEPGAVVATAPDRLASGHEEIRGALGEFLARGVTLTLGDQQPTLRAGDLALTSTRLQDGAVTVEVARRQPDGSWRWVVDRWNVLDE